MHRYIYNHIIGAYSINAEALKNVGVTTLSTVSNSHKTRLLESSKKYGDAYIKGITTSENGLRTACENMRAILSNTLSKPMTATVPVTISPIETGGGDSDTPKVDSNAVGTTYFGGGFITVNEHGYEIMDLPTGTRIYPHSESEKMMNSSPNVSVAVNVYGGIFGIEDAIEVIGDGVCERVVTLVNAM